MNRKSFLAELRSLLAFLDAGERERVLNRYERMFDEAGPEGESAVIRCFGSPVRQVLQIEREYRDALAAGETPFADGAPSEPEPSGEPAEELPEEAPEYSDNIDDIEETCAETAPAAEESFAAAEEAAQYAIPETEMPLPEEAAKMPAAPVLAGLPELDFSDLDLPGLELDIPEEPAAEAVLGEELVHIEEELLVPVQPDSEAEEMTQPYEPSSEAEEKAQPEESAAETEEAVQSEAPAAAEPEDEIRIVEETVSVLPEEPAAEAPAQPEAAPADDVPAEEPYTDEPYAEEPHGESEAYGETEKTEEPDSSGETDESEEYEVISEHPPVSGGRAFGAVMVTIPMLALWAVLFGLSLGLGIAVLAIGASLGVGGVYIAGYVFNGTISYMPDLLLTAGAALAALALALLLVWSGLSIAISGCSATVRLTRSIYRSILYPKKGDNRDE